LHKQSVPDNVLKFWGLQSLQVPYEPKHL
jgi:hypothetical protein